MGPLRLGLVVLALLTLAPAVSAAAEAAGAARAPAAPSVYVAETGHNLSGPFQAFYAANGGLPIFGHPITEQLAEEGRVVQYFERARMELHPDGTLTLGRLGALLTEGRTDRPFQVPQPPPAGRAPRAATGHTLGGPFLAFWEQHGGAAIFGEPISEEFIDQVDGAVLLVQYFERARLEYLPPGNGGDGAPRLGALGTLYAQRLPPRLRARAQPITRLAESRLAYAAGTPEAANIELAATRLDGLVIAPGASLSYLGAVGEVSRAAGFQPGQAIVGGAVVADAVGGGICVVSTALYRAAFYAGLEILSQRAHSLALSAFQSDPGLDAAVSWPSLDLRWRNDTPAPVTVVARAQGGALVVSLWGVADGRQVTVGSPVTRDRVAPRPATWRLDPSLAAGAVRWVTRGGSGMTITRTRVVTAADGTIMRRDTVAARYIPWSGLALHGAGVTPPSAAAEAGKDT